METILLRTRRYRDLYVLCARVFVMPVVLKMVKAPSVCVVSWYDSYENAIKKSRAFVCCDSFAVERKKLPFPL